MRRGHTREGWHSRRVRKYSPRGFTLLEVAVALGVFVAFAVSIATVTVSATSAHSQLRVRTNAVSALDYALSALEAANPYTELAVGDVVIPADQTGVCTAGTDGCLFTRAERSALERCITTLTPGLLEGCVLYGNSALKVSYAAEPQSRPLIDSSESYTGAVKLVAEAVLPSGRQVRAARTVISPVVGASSDRGYVNVILSGNLDGLYQQNTLQGDTLVPLVPKLRLERDSDGTLVTETALDLTIRPDRVLIRVDVAETSCTTADPCRITLVDGGSYSISDRFVARGANRVIVQPGDTATVAVQLATGPGIRVRLDTRPTRESTLLRGPEPGSVCLWGTFDHPDEPGIVVTSWCNINNPFEVDIRGWDDNGVERELPASTAGGQDGISLWVNPPTPLPALAPPDQEVDCTPGTTPDNGIDTPDARMRAFDGSAWIQQETCTGWTWGMPERIVFSELNERIYREGQTIVPVFASIDRRITLLWTPEGGGPAAGCSPADPNWSYPRTVPAPTDWDPEASVGSCADQLDALKVAPQWTDSTLNTTASTAVDYVDGVRASGVPAPLYSISAGQLPEGISLNSATGAVSGRPGTAGTFTFTIQATSSESTISENFTITVTNP